MSKPTSQEKRQEWQEKIFQQQKSGQSVARWCRERQIPPSSFCAWKKRLMPDPPLNRSSFQELLEASQKTELKIEYRGICITLSKEFDEAALLRCIRTFGGFSC